MTDRKLEDEVAARVADGDPIDWDEALDSTPDAAGRSLLKQLRLVESVARVHRSAGSGGPDPIGALGTTMSTIDKTATVIAPPEGPDSMPRTWGRLELREKLGEGAFGEVWRAWDPRLDREVALKLLKPAGSGRATVAARVIEEGRLLAKLRHPNVVTVFGAEIHDDKVGLWMDFIRGRSLEDLLREQGSFGAREAALVGIELCRALAAVHRAGVVHRDVKAQNAMREEGGRIVLMDFGAGVELRDEDARTRSISGTPFYMAPELFSGAPATERSDIYSLGILLYRLVTNEFPIEAKTWAELRAKHDRREGRLLRDRRSDLPEGFVRAVERAMAWSPDERFTTAGQMEQALATALGIEREVVPAPAPASPPPAESARRTHRAFVWGGLGLAAAALVAAALMLAKRDLPVEPPGAVPRPVAPGPQSTAILEPPAAAGVESPAPPAPPPAAADGYTVEASFFRDKGNERERLEPGSRLAIGDALQLEFRASEPLWVYVINEDEQGRSYALFPLPGFELQNPLPADTTHLLPGVMDGKSRPWKVDSVGGREHLLVLASQTRLTDFEKDMEGLAKPGQLAVAIPEAAKIRLRGIGGLAEGAAPVKTKSAKHLFEMAERLASRSQMKQGEVWKRHIDLENPPPRRDGG